MAGPNQTGDTNKKEEEKRQDDNITLTSNQSDADVTAIQDDVAAPSSSSFTISDNDTDQEKSDKRAELQMEQDIDAAQENAESPQESVMVGRDKNNIGENATSNAVLNAATAQTTGPTAQDIADDNAPVESIFTASPHSNQVALDQIGKGQQGIEGSIAGVMGVTDTATMERKRREQDSIANIRAIAMTAEIAAGYAAIAEEMGDMNDDITDMTAAFAEIDNQVQEIIGELTTKQDAIQTRVDELKQELRELRNGTSPLDSGDDRDMTTAQITLKEAEIENAEARRDLIGNMIDSIGKEAQETKQELGEAQAKYDSLKQQEYIARTTGDPNDNLAKIQQQMEEAQSAIQTAKDSIEDLRNDAKITESISKLVTELKGESQNCGSTAQIELAKTTEINARTELINTLAAATADNNIDEAELEDITNKIDTAGISPEARKDFLTSFVATNGGTLTVTDPTDSDKKVTLSGAEAEAYLISQWAEIQEEIQDATDASIDHTALGDALKLELAASEAQTAQLQSDVTDAQETVKHEQAESNAATAGAIDIKEMTIQYDSVYDYMSENYSVTIAFIDFGKGENIDDVANDSTRALRDQDDNLVYVDPDTQRMYTLQKDDNGNVARDTDGNQIHVAVSSLETIQLYQKMYAEKLLPRNFFRDEGGVYKEYSEADSFAEGIGKSILPGWMGNNQREAIIAEAEAEEKQDAVEAKAAASEANTALSTAQDDLSNKENTLNTHNAKTEDIRARMNAAYLVAEKFETKNPKAVAASAKEASPVETVADNNTETTEKTEDTAETTTATDKTDNASDTQWESTEEHKLNTPEHSLAEAEKSHNAALEKVELAALHGESLSQEDYDTLKSAPGMSAEQLDDMMTHNKVTLENNPTAAQNQNNTVTNTATIIRFGTVHAPLTINTPSTPTPDQNGISPATKYESFADSPAFTNSNDPSSTTNSYDSVAVKQAEEPPVVTSGFTAATLNKPEENAGVDSPTVGGMTVLQAEELRRLEEQRQALLVAGMSAQGGAGGGNVTG